MLAVVLRAVGEAALVRLAQQRVKRLVLPGAKNDRGQAKGNNVFESLNRISGGSGGREELGTGRPEVNDSLN